MPDADDFDVEELRRLVRGERPEPAPAPAARPAPRTAGSGRAQRQKPAAAKRRPKAGPKRP